MTLTGILKVNRAPMNLCWQHLEEAGGNSAEINGKPRAEQNNKVLFARTGYRISPSGKIFFKISSGLVCSERYKK